MLYHLHELKNAAMLPTKIWSDAINIMASSLPEEMNPYSNLMTATSEIVGRSIKTFSKPEFGLKTAIRDGVEVSIVEKKTIIKPFCTLLHFERQLKNKAVDFKDPKVLICAPYSGHFATLLRDTARAMIPDHDVYITDWHDARHVPMKEGEFNFQTYVDYLLDFIRYLGPNVHIIAVCQPSVPLLAAVSLLADYEEECQPKSMTLMGGPIDTRINPGKVNEFANDHSLDWYTQNLTTVVPHTYEGGGRRVCPGFLMIHGFMSLNIERHKEASVNLFQDLVKGDSEGADAHKKFYDEYRAVLDMPAHYYIDSIRIAFKDFSLPQRQLLWRGYLVLPSKIERTALMTIEGELDDISCVGQTAAAHDLCDRLPKSMHATHIQMGVGHYGIFNGRRWREQIQPKIAAFIREFD